MQIERHRIHIYLLEDTVTKIKAILMRDQIIAKSVSLSCAGLVAKTTSVHAMSITGFLYRRQTYQPPTL